VAKLSVDQALLKARAHAQKGEIEDAKKLYQTVLHAFPHNKRAQQGLALLNKPKQAAAQTPPQEIINQLVNLYNQGQLAEVVEQAQSLTQQYPEAFFIWNILGAGNKGLGRIQAASEAFKKVTELNSTYADGFSNLGVTLKDQGKLDEAIASYKKALSLKPDCAEAFNNMGNALKDQGKLDEAIASYEKALSLKPDYAEAFNNMGNALQEQGKLEEAIASYEKALSLKPDYAEAYNNLGVALKDQGKLDEAIASYEKALSLNPDYPYGCGLYPVRSLVNLLESVS
jgi:tetratricopeptide (TPR) repeat protein